MMSLAASTLLLAPALVPALPAPQGGPEPGGVFEETGDSWLGRETSDNYGETLALLGDLDGDGVRDFLVGSGIADASGLVNSGRVEVVSGATRSVLFELAGSAGLESLGAAAAPAGDVDGDGREDFALGAPGAAGGGAVSVHAASGLQLRTIPAPAASGAFGAALALLDDLDGDGIPELAVGDPEADTPGLGGQTGRVSVHAGADGSLLWSAGGIAPGDRLGEVLAAVGDVDGDGLADLLAGAPGADLPGLPASGAARLLSGADGSLLWEARGTAAFASFGSQVAGPGDVDGDGVPDLVVAAPRDPLSAAGSGNGRVQVFSGADGSLLWERLGQRGEEAGRALAVLEDLDGDGVSELAVGADGGAHGGIVFVVSGVDGTELVRIESPGNMSLGYGTSLLGLGDLDGDGAPELLLSDPSALVYANGTVTTKGAVWHFAWKPALSLSPSSISASAGGDLQVDLDFRYQSLVVAPGFPAFRYHLLVSAAGPGPTVLEGLAVPLTEDALYAASLAGSYPGSLAETADGPLDFQGNATLTIPVLPGQLTPLTGRTLWLAAVAYDLAPGLGPVYLHAASRAVGLRVVP